MAQQETPQDKRRRHTRVDNVIYANFGAKTTVRTEPEAPEIVESRNFPQLLCESATWLRRKQTPAG